MCTVIPWQQAWNMHMGCSHAGMLCARAPTPWRPPVGHLLQSQVLVALRPACVADPGAAEGEHISHGVPLEVLAVGGSEGGNRSSQGVPEGGEEARSRRHCRWEGLTTLLIGSAGPPMAQAVSGGSPRIYDTLGASLSEVVNIAVDARLGCNPSVPEAAMHLSQALNGNKFRVQVSLPVDASVRAAK